MEVPVQRTNDSRSTLANLLGLVENAAGTIEQLMAKVQRQELRIRELEQAEILLRQDAERYRRFRDYVQTLPADEGGFHAQGKSYASFDEAFDAAYAAIEQLD